MVMGLGPYRPIKDLERALERGELELAIAAAKDVARAYGRPIQLDIAVRFLPVVAEQRPEDYDGWALRWLARWSTESPGATRLSGRSAMRRCVFCDQEIASKDPPEHVVPKWMKRFRPEGALFAHRPGIVLRGTYAAPSELPSFESKQPELTTDVVCKGCNGGWMSDLETRASRLIAPMMEGHGRPLDPDDRAFVAVWGIKTVMMWQTIYPDSRAIPLEDYCWLRERLTPPPITRVRIGRYIGTGLPLFGFAQENLFRAGTPEVAPGQLMPHGHRSVLAVGQLIYEVLRADDLDANQPFPALTGDALLDIWPGIGPSYWPPRLAFDDVRMRELLRVPADAELPGREGF